MICTAAAWFALVVHGCQQQKGLQRWAWTIFFAEVIQTGCAHLSALHWIPSGFLIHLQHEE